MSKTALGSSLEPLPAEFGEGLPEGLLAGLLPGLPGGLLVGLLGGLADGGAPDFPVLAGAVAPGPEPDLAEGEEVPDDGAPEPLAPLLPADPPLAEPVLPAGGGMDGVVQAASHSVAASPTMRLKLRGLSMFNRLPADDWKYSARPGSDCLLHPASARHGALC